MAGTAVDQRPIDVSSLQKSLPWTLCAALWLVFSCHDASVIVGKLPPEIPAARVDSGVRDAGDPHAADGVTAPNAGTSAAPPAEDAAARSYPDSPRTNPQVDLSRYKVSIEAGPTSEFCKRRGVALTSKRADDLPADCAINIAHEVFAYGLCACEELRVEPKTFLIDSFDSSQGLYKPGQSGGNVGVNSSNLQLADDSQILGGLAIAGAGTFALTAARFVVSGDLKSNATLRVNAENQRIGRDLWSAADIVVERGKLRVDRDAYQARGRSGLDAIEIAGQRYLADGFRVPPPCACQGDAPIDVAALVRQAADENDNAAVSFDPGSLNIVGPITDARVLPCGRLHAPSLSLQTLNTYGLTSDSRTALFIQGDLKVASVATLTINDNTLGPTGDLDLFIAGDLIVEASSTLALGNAARPAATRVFVAGQIIAQGYIQLAAQLYAPNATFSSDGPAVDPDDYGAIYARKILLKTKGFHYDRAILQSSDSCSAQAPWRCTGCNDCPDNLSCSQGTCQPCQSDADCCEPLACNAGKCRVLASAWP